MDPALLLRYVEGRSSVSERRAVEDWLAQAAANREELDRLERAWRLSADLPRPDFDIDALWQRIRARLDDVPAASVGAKGAVQRSAPRATSLAAGPSRRRAQPVRPWSWAGLGVRGGLLAAAIAAAVVVYRDPRPAPTEPHEQRMHTYATRPGEKARVTLPDGTKAVLSGATTLRVPERYSAGTRDVFLDGEAYFEVAYDPENVFRVHTARMTAEDRGTRFTVVAYEADGGAEVAVAEGVVAVAAHDSAAAVVLDSADVAHVSATGEVTARRDVAIDKYFS